MASYLRELERDGSLPPLRTSSGMSRDSRRVNFTEERYARSTSPRARSPRARSPSTIQLITRPESPHYAPRPPSPGRRNATEMQEQIRSFRDELQKKDELIQKLVSMESVQKVSVRSQADSVRFEHLYTGDRQSLDAARSELAALQVRTEKQQNKIRELENELEVRDIKIKELQLQMETGRDNENRLQALVESLRSQITDLEGRAGAFESVAGRSEFTVAALQKENKAAQERIVDLETRQRKQLEEREEAQARVEVLDRKIREFYSQTATLLSFESVTGGVPTPEEISRRVSEVMEENSLLKGKLLTLRETLNNSELESKASRETIMRLVSEMGKEQENQTRYSNEISTLRSERDVERSARKELEREVDLLRERLESLQRTIDAQRNEIDIRESRIATMDREIRTSSSTHMSASTQFSMFREKIANILGISECDEEYIRRRIEDIAYSSSGQREKIEMLELRVRELTEQLESQYGLHKTAAARARTAEVEAKEYQKRLHSIEGELVAGDVLRDGFRSDKEKYMRCLQQLGEAMKMDRISLDLGMDMTVDALIVRAQQLVKLEKDALADRSTHIYNLQRKTKSLKEQLESKDLHIDLLRKKLTSLEEKILSKSTIERERDTETLRVRKIEKAVEKYKVKLEDAHQEITNLKAQLLGASELRVRTLEQRKEVEEMSRNLEDLEKLRRKQAHKIRELKSEVDCSQKTSEESRLVADNAVQALTSELKTTKTALGTIQSREKQLLDFRNVVARMLGLDINTLAIPDYEIISRLEKLIQGYHSHAFTTLSLEEALADMETGFMTGYDQYRNTMGANESNNIRRSRERMKRKVLKQRARSVSPTRRVTDVKCY